MTSAAESTGLVSGPSIWSSVLRGLQLPFAEQNLDFLALLESCEIEPGDLSRAHSKIPLERYLKLMNRAAGLANDPLLGIRLARTCGPETLGAVGFLFLSSRTLAEALSDLCTYLTLLQDATDFQFVRNRDSIAFHYSLYGAADVDCRQDVEFSLCLTARLIRMFGGSDIEIGAFYFRHSPQLPVSEYERLLRAPTYFNQECNCVTLPAVMANVRGQALDANLSDLLKEFLDDEAAQRGRLRTFADQVRQILLGGRIQAPVTARKLARYLNTSTATLHRRLAKQDTTLREIVDQVNFETARNYLSSSSLPVTQIGYILGYAEAASFTRAFQRWSGGLTPSAYRRMEADQRNQSSTSPSP